MSNRYCIRGAIAALLLALGGTGASHLTAQTGAVTGVITDVSTRQPLEGATVNLAGTPASALTDAGGRYLLDGVPPGTYTVKVVVPGYGTRSREVEVMPEGTLEIDFRLRVSGVDPDQLVAVGFAGRTERRKIGAAVPTIDLDRLAETTPLDGFSQVLEGRIPGVRSNGTNGGIGAGRELRIRGTDSFGYTRQRPLVFIDGVRIDTNKEEWGWMEGVSCCFFSGGAGEDRLSDLNPEEVDRVEVLRGPAAAALFGAEGSAGVIRVFTKRGRNNTPPTFTLNTGIGFNRLRANLPTRRRAYFTGPGGFAALDPNEHLIEDGLVNNYDLTVSGGGEDVTYFVAGGLTYEEGSVKPNKQTRGNLRVNLNWTAAENLTVGVASGHVRNRIWSLQSGNNWLGVYTNAVMSNPLKATEEEPYGGGLGELGVSVADAKAVRTISDTDRWTGRIQVDYRPSPNFTHRLTVGADQVSEQKTRNLPRGRYYASAGDQGEKNVGYRASRKYTLDFLSTYDYDNLVGMSFLSGSVSVGAQAYRDNVSTVMATGRGFPEGSSFSIADAMENFGDDSTYEESSRGVFLLNRLDLQENLFLTAAVRVDDHSAFGDNIDTQVYPKADIAYGVPQSVLPAAISNLRFRAAYGVAGKPPPRDKEQRVRDSRSGNTVTVPASQDREPENKREVETGLDVGLLNDRIGVELTYYKARVLNALFPQTTGDPPYFRAENSIEIMNRGFEAAVKAWLIDTPAFRWKMNLAYEWNENSITGFGPQAPDDSMPVYRQRDDGTWEHRGWRHTKQLGGFHTGESLDNIYYYDIAGYDPDTNTHELTRWPFIRGRAHPTHMGSVFNSFRIGTRLRLAFQLRGEMGAVMQNRDRTEGVRRRVHDEYMIHLDTEGSPTSYKADSVYDYHRVTRVADKRDHVRLQEVSLSYTVPREMAGMLGLQRTTVTLSGYNLHWWDDCNCQDPNAKFHATDTGSNSTVAFMALPQPRKFLLSVRTHF